MDYEVVWSGSIDRENVVRSQRIAAPPLTERRALNRGKVLRAMEAKPGRVWSMEDLGRLAYLAEAALGDALKVLQAEGVVCMEYVSEKRGAGWARVLRIWLAG